jgi:hypothetical protein
MKCTPLLTLYVKAIRILGVMLACYLVQGAVLAQVDTLKLTNAEVLAAPQ